jgi:hypothetical protein
MKIPQFIHAVSERLEKWATDLLPAAAPGSSRYSIHRHLLAGGLIVLLLAGAWAVGRQRPRSPVRSSRKAQSSSIRT